MKFNKWFLGLACIGALVFASAARAQNTATNASGGTGTVQDLLGSGNTATIAGGLSEIYSAISSSGLLTATNYAIEPYGTYAPKLPTKIGGGVLALYNLDKYVAPGLGVDWLGQFEMISANATLKLPLHPLTSFSWLPAWATNAEVVPFQLVGGGVGLFGNTSSGVVITDTGAYIGFGHVWGGSLNAGAAWGQWMNAGPYSGKRYHIFFGWSKGF